MTDGPGKSVKARDFGFVRESPWHRRTLIVLGSSIQARLYSVDVYFLTCSV